VSAFFLTVMDIDGPPVDVEINGKVIGHAVCQGTSFEPQPTYSPVNGSSLPWSVRILRHDGSVLAAFLEVGGHGPRTLFIRTTGAYEDSYGANPGPAPAATCVPS
jgi:hypothetical protein